jgi:integrase
VAVKKRAPGTPKAKDRDGLYKRRGYWHFDFKDPDTGKWRSKTTEKTNYNDAKEFKARFTENLGTGKYNPGNDRTKFVEAAGSYIRHREVSAAAGTVRLEKERLRALTRVLAQLAGPSLALRGINIELVRAYQQARIREGVAPRTVNMEGQLLRSVLKHHGQWKLEEGYERLPEPLSELGRALSPEEEVRLLDTARSRESWFVAYHATVVENETGMRGVEVRNLQLKRIHVGIREIHLQKSKTKGGVRTISLSADALDSVVALMERARQLGASHPDHFLIPARVNRVQATDNGRRSVVRAYDPAKPTKGWRTAWRNLTRKAGLKGLRGHDLRHNWITGHAEIGTPQSVLEAQAGHLSKQMSDLYKHIREKAARKATDELARIRAEQRAAARAKLDQEKKELRAEGTSEVPLPDAPAPKKK